FATRKVPCLHLVVGTARGDRLAVGAERDAQHQILMTLRPGECLQLFASGRVPELERLVKTGRDDLLAVRGVEDGVHGLRVSLQDLCHDGRQLLRFIRAYPAHRDEERQAGSASHGQRSKGIGHGKTSWGGTGGGWVAAGKPRGRVVSRAAWQVSTV